MSVFGVDYDVGEVKLDHCQVASHFAESAVEDLIELRKIEVDYVPLSLETFVLVKAIGVHIGLE